MYMNLLVILGDECFNRETPRFIFQGVAVNEGVLLGVGVIEGVMLGVGVRVTIAVNI